MSESNKVEMLRGPNYNIWALKMKAVLKAKKLFKSVIEGEEPDDCSDITSPEGKIRQEWEEKNDEAFSIIILSLSSDQAGMFLDEYSASRVWKNLESMYAGDRENKIIDLSIELKELEMSADENVDSYMTRAKNILANITSLGKIMEPKEITHYIVRGIHEKLENVAIILRTKRDSTLEEVHRALKEEENRILKINKKSLPPHQINQEKAFKTQRRQLKPPPKYNESNKRACFICGKIGHIAKNCWHRKDNKTTMATGGMSNRNKGTAYGKARTWNTAKTADNNENTRENVNYALTGRETNNIEKLYETNAATKVQTPNYSQWNLDSGCSVHMTSERDILCNVEKYESEISMAESGRVIKATAKGEVKMEIKTQEKNVKIRMKNVLYVPKLKDNLMSVKELVNRGNEVNFNKQGATIYGKKGLILAQAHLCNNMYLIKGKVIKDNEDQPDTACKINTEHENKNVEEIKNNKQLWHNRLGHINEVYMNMMKDKCMVDGLMYRKSDAFDCEYCILGKLSRSKFVTQPKEYTEKPLQLLNVDLCGPMPVNSIGGNRFMFTIVDSYTRRIFVELLKSKNEAFEKFMIFKSRREKELNTKICRVRSDNGTEFVNYKFDKMFKEEGIKHERTIVYTPQSNGRAERANRTILDTARTLLVSAGLPIRFWAEAVATAAYLHNCSYKKALEDSTPIEKWTGRKPTVSHLKTFGCLAYCWVNKVHRNKLEPKAVKGIFLGYSRNRKAYRIYLPEDNKIEETRDVKFNENKRGVDHVRIPNLGNLNVEEIEYRLVRDTEEQPQQLVNEELEPDDENEQNLRDDMREEPGTNEGQNTIETEEPPEMIRRGRPIGTRKGVVAERDKRIQMEREQELRNRGVRRSNRIIEREQGHQMVVQELEAPNTYGEAIKSEYQKEWETAMRDEITSLKEHKVWKLVERRSDMKVLRSRWIYSLKRDDKGKVLRPKARLVVAGNHQVKGIDYTESYAPVVKTETLRLIVALAAKYKLNLYRYDVKTAYLYGDLQEDIYMAQPIGWTDGTNKVCKLQKSLYGLPQSGKNWNVRLNDVLTKLGLRRLTTDPSVYIIRNGKEFIIMGIYVDDCIVAGTDDKWIEKVMGDLQKEFKMTKEVGDGTFLGIEIRKTENGYRITQKAQIEKILKVYGMDECKAVRTPVDTNQNVEIYEESKPVDVQSYQEIIGSLSYVSNGTRPDITYAVNKLAQFNKNPREVHLEATKRIMRYLQGTKDLGLEYTNHEGTLEASSDASWCSTGDRRSHTGYCLSIGGSVITWKTKKQELVALSTCEAEINALCETVKEVAWMGNILEELEMEKCIERPVKIYTDSKSAMEWAQGMTVKQRTKHFDRKMYKVREEVERGAVNLMHRPTEILEADIFTKGVTWEKLKAMRLALNLS